MKKLTAIMTCAAALMLPSCIFCSTPRTAEASAAPIAVSVLLESGKTYALPGDGATLRCLADESTYVCGKRILLVPRGGSAQEHGNGPRNFLLYPGAAGTFALVHAPVSKESTLTLYRLTESGRAKVLWRSPKSVNERVQWRLLRWEEGDATLLRSGEASGQRCIRVPLSGED